MKIKLIASLALIAAASSAQAVGIFQEFTVNEGSVPGAMVNTLVADKLNGGYNEVLTLNPDFSFSSTAYGDIGQFYKNDGADSIGSGLGAVGAIFPQQYSMYATFTSNGVLTPGGFVGSSGSLYLYIDPNSDSIKTLGATGSSAVAVANSSDDYLIAFSTTISSMVGLPGTPGAYDFWFTKLALTTGDQDGNAGNGVQNGANYFTSPDPFHAVVQVNGDFDAFNTVVSGGPGTYTGLSGDVSAVFPIPEPGALALVGLGLLGAGIVRRRKVAA